ncbi:Protein held out wings [Gryllus bimaculatus]|nr:Protein held out wings [Gryllus bimaculatus]
MGVSDGKFNFVGKLLGPKGNSLKRLQEETMTKMAVLGRGSMRDKHKEEELRASTDPKYAHFNDDLHVEITAFAPPAEAHARIAYALAEVRKFMVPDYNDEIRQEQMREMQILNTAGAGALPADVAAAVSAASSPAPSQSPSPPKPRGRRGRRRGGGGLGAPPALPHALRRRRAGGGGGGRGGGAAGGAALGSPLGKGGGAAAASSPSWPAGRAPPTPRTPPTRAPPRGRRRRGLVVCGSSPRRRGRRAPPAGRPAQRATRSNRLAGRRGGRRRGQRISRALALALALAAEGRVMPVRDGLATNLAQMALAYGLLESFANGNGILTADTMEDIAASQEAGANGQQGECPAPRAPKRFSILCRFVSL